MTNWRVALLSVSILLAFRGCDTLLISRFQLIQFSKAPALLIACSLKCYQCITYSEKECERNQTLTECRGPSFHCATAMFTRVGYDGNIFSQTYMKRCLPLAIINAGCNTFNKTGLLYNCSISSCDVDYCNGPTPTTPTVRTEVTTTTSESTSQEPGATQKGPVARAGSPSTIFTSSAFSLILTIFALGKILEICSAS